MKLQRCLMGSAVLLASVSLCSHAAPSAEEQSERILAYWTPDRLRDATPENLPTIKAKDDVAISSAISSSAPSVTGKALEPTLHLQPDYTPMYAPKMYTATSKVGDVGKAELQFSSTRLVPQNANLTYPYSTAGKIFFTKPSGSNSWCSASVINKRIVLTAGHCVYSTAGYNKNFVFVPAFINDTAPFKKWPGSYALATPSWIKSPSVSNVADQALIEINDSVIDGKTTNLSAVTGALSYATNKLTPNQVHILGYPCNLDNCKIIHQITAQNGPTVANNNVKYGSDMGGGGSSGSPFIQNFGIMATGQTGGLNSARNTVVGVLSWGYSDTTLKVQGASPLGDEFLGILKTVCAHKAGNCA
jgi:V8-like Glu-specific endopeptidase